MALKLKIILIVVMILLLIYIIKSIKKGKINVKNALIWLISDIIVILCILFIEPLFEFANFLGIETVSNMIFFISIIFLLVLSFNQTAEISKLNKKIVVLTEEIGILKREMKK